MQQDKWERKSAVVIGTKPAETFRMVRSLSAALVIPAGVVWKGKGFLFVIQWIKPRTTLSRSTLVPVGHIKKCVDYTGALTVLNNWLVF